MTAYGYGFLFFWGDEKVLKLDAAYGCLMSEYNKTMNCTIVKGQI